MNRLILLISIFIIFCGVRTNAHTLTYTTSTVKANQVINKKLNLADPLGDEQIVGTRKATVKLNYGRQAQTDVETTTWAYRVTYDLKQVGRVTPLVTGGVLTIYVQEGGSVYDAANQFVLDMPNTTILAKVELTITKVEAALTKDAAFSTNVAAIPSDVRLELFMDVERFDDITGSPTAVHQYFDAEKSLQIATISWDYLKGSESYELEWVYVDDKINTPISTTEELFARATRIETSQNFYDISLTYPSGKIYYRVRGLGRYTGTDVSGDYSHLKYSDWSSLCTSNFILDPFSNLNIWTATTAYSEDGKYKKVVQYYDNSLRNRETQTNLSTEKVTLAAATLYDVEGRASVNVLPSPILGDNTLQFKGILKNYKRSSFDKATGADALGATTNDGAGNYFSPSLATNSAIIYRNFIDDAMGYPMVQTRFLNDGTGRVASQSGVGKNYKIGSGHETQYFYNTPSSTQLRRLFGKNVGDAKYYKQNVVLDPNGQASMSYVDQTGKVIATSMIGNSPTNVLPINETVPTNIKESLSDLNRLNTEGGASILNYSVFNLADNGGNTHQIDYSFNQVVTAPTPCPLCRYKLSIRVESPENSGANGFSTVTGGTVVDKGTNQEFVSEETLEGTQICSGLTRTYSLKFEKTGTYKISKELILLRKTGAEIRDDVFNTGLTSSGTTWGALLTSMTNDYQLRVNPMECAQSCEEYARAFIDKKYPINTANPNDPINTQRYVIYATKIKECEQGAVNADNSTAVDDCESLKGQLVAQMMPGGCIYADAAKWELWVGTGGINIPIRNGSNITTITALRAYITSLNGERDNLLEDALAAKHKEYGHYQWCIKTKNLRDFDRKLARIRFNDLSVTSNELLLDVITDINTTATVQNWIINLVDNNDPATRTFIKPTDNFVSKLKLQLNTASWSSDDCQTPQTFYQFIQCGSLANAMTLEAKEEKWRKIILLYLGAREKVINDIRNTYTIATAPEDFTSCWLPKTDECAIVSDYRDIFTATSPTTWKSNQTGLGGMLFKDDCTSRFNEQMDGYLQELKRQFPNTIDQPNNSANIDGPIKQALIAYGEYTCGSTTTPPPNNPYGFLLNDPTNTANQSKLDAIQAALNSYGMGTWIVKDRWAKAWADVYDPNGGDVISACGQAVFDIFKNNFTFGVSQVVFPLSACGVNYVARVEVIGTDGCTTNLTPPAITMCPTYLPSGGYSNCFKQVVRIYPSSSNIIPCNTGYSYIGQYELVGDQTNLLYNTANLSMSNSTPIVDGPNNISFKNGNSASIRIKGFGPDLTQKILTLKTQSIAQTQYETAQQLYENCIAQQQEYYKSLAYEDWKKLLDAAVAAKINEYNRSCINNVSENIVLTRPNKEYQYTLYYYDQSGSLLQTVPPEGVTVLPLVAPYFDPNGKWIYTTTDDVPNHTLRTRYIYNSLGQVLWQKTPDGGINEFAYDYAQRLRFSQNDKQRGENGDIPVNGQYLAGNGNYSYTKYDDLGRVIEAGKVDKPTAANFFAEAIKDANVNNIAFPLANPNLAATTDILVEVNATTYSGNETANGIVQNNTRNRVSSVKTRNLNSTTDDILTYYDYDEHGNVKTLFHNITALSKVIKIEYKYDLISNKVTEVAYQRGQIDQYQHRYTYDADNRLTNVYTSANGTFWERDARYFYYLHGPMARMELGNDKVQGSDYIYTMQGWIKAVNLPGMRSETFEPGKDGNTTGINRYMARDEMSYVLGYNQEDYKSIDPTMTTTDANSQGLGRQTLNMWYNAAGQPTLSTNILQKNNKAGLYNGNITAMITSIRRLAFDQTNPLIPSTQRKEVATAYQYDALHRIRKSLDYRFDGDDGFGAGSWAFISTGSQITGDNHTEYTYDGNGNINTLKRWNNGNPMDDITYTYNKTGGKLNNNKLISVNDAVQTSIDGDELKPNLHSFTYDAIGNLTSNATNGISNIVWNVQGKIASVTRAVGGTINYTYDAAGNRLTKTFNGITSVYVRDAQGNVLSVYEKNTAVSAVFFQKEVHLYGSSRIGEQTYTTERPLGISVPTTVEVTRGKKFFELSNHLGNVLSVITDQKRWHTEGGGSYYVATVVSATDYYPFGMAIGGRKYNPNTYRFGFNGKENDADWGTEMVQDYGFRVYSPALAKFLSVDPLSLKYPELTPYQFASNRPIQGIDLDGLEFLAVNHPIFKPTAFQRLQTFLGIEVKLLKNEYDKHYKKTTIAGQEYYDVGKHLYAKDGNINETGTRKEQITEATKVGITLVHMVDNLKPGKPPHKKIDWDTKNNDEIRQSQKDALEYNECEGVCYATNGARYNGAYKILYKKDVLDLTISGRNPDHIIASGQAPYGYGSYGLGQALINHGFGEAVTEVDVWNGKLQTGAAIQIWWTIKDQNGHSFFFRDYTYDKDGNIDGFNYTDYHGGIRNKKRSEWEKQPNHSVKAVNIKDKTD